ncbi:MULTISPECIES: Ig-like domain-containing protein [unclassified Rhodococcus (in: high G+C Gram-positive bacteria)]|uniref:Ig-like domain-containing protein n=1 Tax=unclassified Rhodococcus (in: high G+C Gram-positive bacteria) TaxID=192944 RepID=UPI0007DB4879|nr:MULTISPECIES: Ig-like domain-containing protein [unclassified Rhodococcus (in: high G+C Gram-positive bacteria)]MDA3635478.1 Ig-like domain-containing protein [Rhodococcus sp. C-2]
MSVSGVRRVVGGLSVFAVSAGFAVVAGVGVAGAAPVTAEFNSDGYKVTRTISNGTPSEGDVITSKTVFKRTAAVHNLYAVRDFHPACMTYVDGSATVNGSAFRVNEVATDSVRLSAGATEWPMWGGDVKTFEFQYRVGADCARGTDLSTTVHFDGTVFVDDTTNGRGPSINVQKNVSTTAVSPVSGAQVGQPVTLSATVTGGADGDSVEFFDAGSKIGAGALANGVAILAWTPTTRGDHSITAKFADTARAVGSASAALIVNVSQADAQSSTTLAPISGAQVGKSTNLKATVSASGTGGTVTFKVGGTVLASVPVAGNGEATYAWVPTVAGAQTVEAVFSGRSGVTGSSTTANVTVAEQPAGTTSSTTDLSVVAGQVGVAQTISAQISPANAGGTVTFKDGETVIGTATVDSSGKASLSWKPATQGQRVVAAEYSGAGTVTASSDQVSVQIAAPVDGEEPGNGTGSLGSLGNIFGS